MKTVILVVTLIVISAAPMLLKADEESVADHSAQYKQLGQQINDYYNVDSSWSVRCRKSASAAACADVQLEATLLHLMGAEVYSWQLRDNLKQRNDEANYTIASSIGTILHEEFLSTAPDAVSALRKHPNERLLKLLIAHLETYPNDWAQEGSEDLLPDLKKLLHAKQK